jgi:hypothetical protein
VVVGALVVILALGAFSQGWRRSGTESAPPDPGTVALAARLAALVPENALVVSDNPGLAYLARRRTPGQLVDTAHLRFETGSLTNADILRILDRSCVVAVVAARQFLPRPELLEGIRRRFAHLESTPSGKLYSGRKAPCSSSVDQAPP